MKLFETIDECINQIKSELKSWKSVKDNENFFSKTEFGSFNDATNEEICDNIVKYQKHLDNLNLLKQELNYDK
jgi:hypothetical protein